MSRASTLVKNAALAMMGTSLLIFPATAQQVATANTGPNFAVCDAIKDPASSVQCYHDTKIAHYKGRIAAADARIEVAEQIGDCADRLKALRLKDASIVERGRLILNGRPLAQYKVCNLVDALTRQ